MTNGPSNGWDDSAAAWIASQGEAGDFGRLYVLDAPILARVRGRGFRNALDIGCGEGRFCRMLQAEGLRTVGIDPTAALIHHARGLDPTGDYRIEAAETMAIEPNSMDLAVCYLSLIDMPNLPPAIERIAAALKPGGTLLIANLNSFNTAGMPTGWAKGRFAIDYYLDERVMWACWRGIRIQNWHRPLSTYLTLLLQNGLELRHFDEPVPTGGPPDKADRYRRVPYFHVMEWQKP